MTILDFKTISYDTDINLLGYNLEDLGTYGGFLSIPSKYNTCGILYVGTINNILQMQIDNSKEH